MGALRHADGLLAPRCKQRFVASSILLLFFDAGSVLGAYEIGEPNVGDPHRMQVDVYATEDIQLAPLHCCGNGRRHPVVSGVSGDQLGHLPLLLHHFQHFANCSADLQVLRSQKVRICQSARSRSAHPNGASHSVSFYFLQRSPAQPSQPCADMLRM